MTDTKPYWNARFANPPSEAIRRTSLLLYGLHITLGIFLASCEDLFEKTLVRKSRKLAKKLIGRNSEPFHLVHSDICGPIGIPLVGNAKHFVNLLDDTLNRSAVCFIHTKNLTEICCRRYDRRTGICSGDPCKRFPNSSGK